MNFEAKNFGYSLKNIPIPTNYQFLLLKVPCGEGEKPNKTNALEMSIL